MFKKLIAAVLCLLLIVSALPVGVYAATTQEEEEEEQRIRDQISEFYWITLRASGEWTLEGWCGLMAGWELYLLGVTKHPMTYNGNDQFDLYRDLDVTSMGHKVKAYPEEEYSIEEAMNTITRCGTFDAYNLMAGFHKTRTAAGQKWGHVTVIHAILDGNVYYTEGFDTPYGLKPEEAQVCSIAEWADFYNSYATFEGMVDFGTKAYIDFCTYYPANLYVVSSKPVRAVSQPGGQMEPQRTIPAGERIHAIGIYESQEGQLYYQIEDSGTVCYIPAEGTGTVCLDYSDLSFTRQVLPEAMEVGEKFAVAGDVYTTNNHISNLSIDILDGTGKAVQSYACKKDSCFTELGSKAVNKVIDLSELTEGYYTYRACVDVTNHYVKDGKVIEQTQHFPLAEQVFAVGAPEGEAPQIARETLGTVPPDGWQLEQGRWRYYENGAPRTGWIIENGLDYYLLEDGAAATGWQMINGKARYFSSTGVLRTGWLTDGEDRYFMLSNGVPAVGWRTIDQSLYCFAKDGRMMTDCLAELDGVQYYLQPDGTAVKESA